MIWGTFQFPYGFSSYGTLEVSQPTLILPGLSRIPFPSSIPLLRGVARWDSVLFIKILDFDLFAIVHGAGLR